MLMTDGPGANRCYNVTYLHRIRHDLLSLESVNDPHCDVCDEQECDNLATRLAPIVLRKVNSSSRDIGYKEQLEDHLKYSECLNCGILIRKLVRNHKPNVHSAFRTSANL